MVIRNVKFSYMDSKFKIGPYIDFVATLEVNDVDYDTIVCAISDGRKDIESVQLISFTK